jgi:hypothetical protein
MLLLNRNGPNYRKFLEDLKQFVSDAPSLVAIIDNYLKPQSGAVELRKLRAQNEKLSTQTERRTAEAHASWVAFWREIVTGPGAVFSPDRAENTAWNLWQALERSGRESRASGWNRKFIEAQFGKDVADRLRETTMKLWRKDKKPTLRSERPKEEKNSFLVRWQFGLAAIAAEAEDPNWAKKLSEPEAELACRYAPIELNGFPSWFERLAVEHPAAVDRILGEELTISLHKMAEANNYSMFLQNISHASAIVIALFIPRIRTWLAEVVNADAESKNPVSEQNLRQGVEILMKSGNEDDRRFIEATAKRRLANSLRAIG